MRYSQPIFNLIRLKGLQNLITCYCLFMSNATTHFTADDIHTEILTSWASDMMNSPTLGIMLENWNGLMDEIEDTDRVEDYVELDRLPTFGGEAPSRDTGALSWDHAQMLVGDGVEYLELEAR